jgi:hypothetical protein
MQPNINTTAEGNAPQNSIKLTLHAIRNTMYQCRVSLGDCREQVDIAASLLATNPRHQLDQKQAQALRREYQRILDVNSRLYNIDRRLNKIAKKVSR